MKKETKQNLIAGTTACERVFKVCIIGAVLTFTVGSSLAFVVDKAERNEAAKRMNRSNNIKK